jgi:L-asparagine transporter-like permease
MSNQKEQNNQNNQTNKLFVNLVIILTFLFIIFSILYYMYKPENKPVIYVTIVEFSALKQELELLTDKVIELEKNKINV